MSAANALSAPGIASLARRKTEKRFECETLRGGGQYTNPDFESELAADDEDELAFGMNDRNPEGRRRVKRGKEEMVQENTLFVRNLHPTLDEEQVFLIFHDAADVLHVNMPRDRMTEQHNGYAFVEFVEELGAEYAFLLLNFLPVHDQPMKITHMVPEDSGKYHPGAKLFLSRLPPTITELDLFRAFKTFGFIMTVHVPLDRATNQSRSIAFIRYTEWDACEKALHLMQGQMIGGRRIMVRYAQDAVLPAHLEGTPWMAGAPKTVPNAATSGMPAWVLEARKALPQEEQEALERAERSAARDPARALPRP